MKELQKEKSLIFFAYPGKDPQKADDNVDAIKAAINKFNPHQTTYEAKTWEDFRQTTVISKEILGAIENCEAFVADLTHFNHNVMFELGYAIGKNKKILILLNPDVIGTKEKYKKTKFLKDIRYTSFTSHKEIHLALQNGHYEGDLISKFLNVEELQQKLNEIFYFKSKVTNQPSLELTDYIDGLKSKSKCKVVSDDSYEVNYRTVSWYFANIFMARIVVFQMLGPDHIDASEENGKNSFFAGFSCSLGREVLLTAPAEFQAPLDYHDIVDTYTSAKELVEKTQAWIEKRIIKVPDNVQVYERELNLIKLGIGCDVAEDEKDDLLKYFITTSPYETALRQNKTIVVGTKGSGKSAIYIRLLNDFNTKNTYLIAIKPDSDDLIEDVKRSELYTSKSKITFFFTVWKLIIFSKLLLNLYEEIKTNPSKTEYTNEEQQIIKFYEENETLITKNFFGVAKEICEKTTNPDFLEQFHSKYLTLMIKTLKNYFGSINIKYLTLVIMADGLDKTWNIEQNYEVQAEMLLGLLDIENKIVNDLTDKRGNKIDVKQIVFLRKDICEFLIRKSGEKEKIIGKMHEINWEEYPALLRKLVESRFKFSLGNQVEMSMDEIWKEYFDFGVDLHPFSVIEKVIIRRPRDVIYFMMRLFESAINSCSLKIRKEELKYALESYNIYLNGYLVTENTADFPNLEDIIEELKTYKSESFLIKELFKICNKHSYDESKTENLIEMLFLKKYLGIMDKDKNELSCDYESYVNETNKKIFKLFKKPIYFQANIRTRVVSKELEKIGISFSQ